MTMSRPEYYDWWVDSVQDCLAQIAGRADLVNDKGRSGHLCDDTALDLHHFISMIDDCGYCDVPTDAMEKLRVYSTLNTAQLRDMGAEAVLLLETSYFKKRNRWRYG